MNGSYTNGSSDGSVDHPWTTIQAGVDAAAPGAVVAVAAGSYVEAVTVTAAPVQLIGVCPDLVEIVVAEVGEPAVLITVGGSSLQRVSLTGPGLGVVATSVDDLLVANVHIHDVSQSALQLLDQLGPASAEVRDSLIEGAVGVGVYVSGTTVRLVRSTVRDVHHSPTVAESLLVAALVGATSGEGADVTVTASLLERSEFAILVQSSSVTVDSSAIRDGIPSPEGLWGVGLQAEDAVDLPSTVVMRAATVERTITAGVAVVGSTAELDRTTVRTVRPPPALHPELEVNSSFGVVIQDASDTGAPAQLTITASRVADVVGLGLFVQGAEATVTRVVTTGIETDEGVRARGINVQQDWLTLQPASATISECLVEAVRECGVFAAQASLTVERSVVRANLARPDAIGGDGVALAHGVAPLLLAGNRIDDNARAGIASFGSAVQVSGNHLSCNTIAINGEDMNTAAFSYEDLGGNRCGCPARDGACKVLSSGISAPEPLQ